TAYRPGWCWSVGLPRNSPTGRSWVTNCDELARASPRLELAQGSTLARALHRGGSDGRQLHRPRRHVRVRAESRHAHSRAAGRPDHPLSRGEDRRLGRVGRRRRPDRVRGASLLPQDRADRAQSLCGACRGPMDRADAREPRFGATDGGNSVAARGANAARRWCSNVLLSQLRWVDMNLAYRVQMKVDFSFGDPSAKPASYVYGLPYPAGL